MALYLQHLENEIIDQYHYDENPTRPWIIVFGGGNYGRYPAGRAFRCNLFALRDKKDFRFNP